MSRNTLDLWLKRRARENTLAPKVRQPDRSRAKLQDLDEFRDFVDAHPDWSQEDGTRARSERFLHRSGSAKDRLQPKRRLKRYCERDESTREGYLETLQQYEAEGRAIFSMDETGYDER